MFLTCQRRLFAGMSGWRCQLVGSQDGRNGGRCRRRVSGAAAGPPFVYLIRSVVISYTGV